MSNIYKIIFAILLIVCLLAIFSMYKPLNMPRANESNESECLLVEEISLLKKGVNKKIGEEL